MERKGIYTMWSRDNGGIIKENSIFSISGYFPAIFYIPLGIEKVIGFTFLILEL